MGALDIELREQGTKGEAVVERDGARLAEMTWSVAGPGLIIVDHTWVDEALRGQGAGRQLLDAVVADARARDRKILPLCPYAKSQFDKDPSLADVLHG